MKSKSHNCGWSAVTFLFQQRHNIGKANVGVDEGAHWVLKDGATTSSYNK